MDLEDLLQALSKEQMEILCSAIEKMKDINKDELSEYRLQDWLDFINDIKNR
jgi:hypothetical protein